MLVAREKIVVPDRCGVAAGVVPRRPAAGGREVPLAVVVDFVEGVLDAFARGLHEARNLHGARLKVFAAAPVLPVDCGAVERPQIAVRIVFGEDEHVGDGRVVEVGELFLREFDFGSARPQIVPLRDGFGEQRLAGFAREFGVARDGPLVGQLDPDCFVAVSGNGEAQRQREPVVFGGDGGAGRFGDERDIFAGAVFEYVADHMAGKIALAAAELERDVGRGRAVIVECETNNVEAFCAGGCGGNFAGLCIGIDGEGEFFEREIARCAPTKR